MSIIISHYNCDQQNEYIGMVCMWLVDRTVTMTNMAKWSIHNVFSTYSFKETATRVIHTQHNNTASPVRLHQPPQSAPAHMLAVQGRI